MLVHLLKKDTKPEGDILKAINSKFGNIEEFRKQNSFKLIGIVVNRKIRFDRLKKLDRREKLNLELFNELDNRDLGIGEKKNGLQVAFCLGLSDIFIENNSSLAELENRVKNVVKEN